MKVIHYSDRFSPLIGGVQTHVENLCMNLPLLNSEVLTNALPGSLITEKFNNKFQVKRIKPFDKTLVPYDNEFLSKMSFPYRLFTDMIRNRRKKQYLRKEDYDILHVHGPALSMNYIRMNHMMKRTMFSELVDFSDIKKPKILTLHGLFSPYSKDKMYKQLEGQLLEQFNTIICVDIFIKNYIENNYPEQLEGKEILFIPNSVDTDKFTFHPFEKSEKLKIGYISRIDTLRGNDTITQLSNNVEDGIELHSIIAGTKRYVEKIENEYTNSDVNILFNQSSSQINQFIRKMDIILNPIELQGISLVTLESMACGRPVIMFDIGNRHPIINEKTGYLIDKNLDSIIKLLNQISQDKSVLEQIGINARKIIEDEFSVQAIMPKIAGVYNSVKN